MSDTPASGYDFLASVLRGAESCPSTSMGCLDDPAQNMASRAVAAVADEPPRPDSQACRQLAACLRPPHLVPPAAAQPLVVRGVYRVNHDGGPQICIGDPITFAVQTWYVPRGHRFTTTRLEVNGLLNTSPGRFGVTVWRNDRVWFSGDAEQLTYPNGVTTSMPPVSKVGQWLASDWAGDGGCTSFGMPFPSTFLPGEKLTVTGSIGGINNGPFVLGVALIGYLYPQESLYDPDHLPAA